jgi:hypothetical protein
LALGAPCSDVCAQPVPGRSAWRWGRCLCLGACLGGPLGALPLLGCLPLVRRRLGGFAFALVPLFYFLSSAICGDLNYRHPTHMCPDGPCVCNRRPLCGKRGDSNYRHPTHMCPDGPCMCNRRPLCGKEVTRIIVIPHIAFGHDGRNRSGSAETYKTTLWQRGDSNYRHPRMCLRAVWTQ